MCVWNCWYTANSRYQAQCPILLFPLDDCSNAVLKNREQTESQKNLRDQATQHTDASMDPEASTDNSPVSYIPAPTVPPLSEDSSLSRVDSDVDDGDEECAVSETDLEADYSDHYSTDYEDDELYSSDGDGLYDSEDCDCECCRSALFSFPPLL